MPPAHPLRASDVRVGVCIEWFGNSRGCGLATTQSFYTPEQVGLAANGSLLMGASSSQFDTLSGCIINSMGARSRKAELFKQSVPAIGLSVERCSSRVPHDGYFYVLLRDEIRGRFRLRAHANELYRALIQQSGYQPEPVVSGAPSSSDTVERYLDEKEAYWSESHRHKRRGGKGRY
jgi:hypothetical protein